MLARFIAVLLAFPSCFGPILAAADEAFELGAEESDVHGVEEGGDAVTGDDDDDADTDDEGDVEGEGSDMEEFDLDDEEGPTDDEHKDQEVLAHPHGQACIDLAEELEQRVGLFDEEMSEEGRHEIGDEMRDFIDKNVGAAKPDFHARLVAELSAGTKGFGASAICRFVLEHHDEL
eukprot:TRINITY_DN9643_c0_g2_i1.p1 TRINITY_DN9643_c0_g2~~TRINITY_DN9643_c0_g2_i1.p1  ORF type:complete len:205 (-),score=59.72 TRINITY_DN9643_c0_g2_i1:73-600(-)